MEAKLFSMGSRRSSGSHAQPEYSILCQSSREDDDVESKFFLLMRFQVSLFGFLDGGIAVAPS